MPRAVGVGDVTERCVEHAPPVVGLINAAIALVGAFVLMAVLDAVLLGVTLATVAVVLVLFATLMPAIA